MGRDQGGGGERDRVRFCGDSWGGDEMMGAVGSCFSSLPPYLSHIFGTQLSLYLIPLKRKTF